MKSSRKFEPLKGAKAARKPMKRRKPSPKPDAVDDQVEPEEDDQVDQVDAKIARREEAAIRGKQVRARMRRVRRRSLRGLFPATRQKVEKNHPQLKTRADDGRMRRK